MNEEMHPSQHQNCAKRNGDRQLFEKSLLLPHNQLVHRKIREILQQEICFIDSKDFHGEKDRQTFLDSMPLSKRKQANPKPPAGLPPYLQSLYLQHPLLTPEQERHLFRKMNYAKFQSAQERVQISQSMQRNGRITKELRNSVSYFDTVWTIAQNTRDTIVSSNLRLVVSLAKTHTHEPVDFFDMVGDGNVYLMKAVDSFDYSLGNKFSTYATWVIRRGLSRMIGTNRKYLFKNSQHAEGSEYEIPERESFALTEQDHGRLRANLLDAIDLLPERDQLIIRGRYAIANAAGEYSDAPLDYKEIGAKLGITHERVRQLHTKAIKKLREISRTNNIELEF